MKFTKGLLAAAGLVAVFCTSPLRADLITNGSFEVPVVPVGGYTNYASGSTAIPGWTVVGAPGGVAIINGTFTAAGVTFEAEDGAQWMDLTGASSNAYEGVQQTFATTSGTQYDLSFWVGNVGDTTDPGGPLGITSTVDVLLGGLGGSTLLVAKNSNITPGMQNWEQFSTTFTATGSSSTLDFINADPPNDNSNGLDNVNVSAVPEPSTLVLLGSGSLGLLGWARRRLA